MSPKLKKGLIIGGISAGVLIIVVLCLLVLIGPAVNRSFSNVANYYAPESGVGGGGYAAPSYDYAEEAPRGAAALPTEAAAYAESGFAQTISTGVQQPQQVERLIIRNGNISMQVEDTRAAKAEIEQMVASMAAEGAFIVSSNEYGGGAGTSPYIDLYIRVPATRFDEVMQRLTAMAVEGTNPSISTSAEDVTAQYVDLEGRLTALTTARDRLLELMQNAATTEDVLMAEQQLTQREAEIEAITGQMRYLAEAARLSAISIQLQPYILSQPVDTRWRPAETFRAAIDALVNGLRDLGDFLIYFSIAVLPFLLIFGAVIYAIVRFIIWRVRVGQRKRAERAAASQE